MNGKGRRWIRKLRLERPSAELASSVAAMRDACLVLGKDEWADRGVIAHTDPVKYTGLLCDWAEARNLPDCWVRADTFWLVEGDRVVAECDVRRELTPALRRGGGHIGYVVHPADRNRGLATFVLQRGLEMLAELGEAKALLTPVATNAASIRVIEKCGGLRIADSPGGRQRYVIALGDPQGMQND